MNRFMLPWIAPLPAALLRLLSCLLFWISSGPLTSVPLAAQSLLERPALPSRIVVLTFDDSVRSHYDVVRPLLLKYNFRATFFITE
ncbi:MAG: polysaccharide deacetylase family protein, partial [Pirellulaceae bacterium]